MKCGRRKGEADHEVKRRGRLIIMVGRHQGVGRRRRPGEKESLGQLSCSAPDPSPPPPSQSFLNLCQGNRHYQFDTVRRAKHSSMMVLYHLHNPDAPTVSTNCNVCNMEIDHGSGYRCTVCPDFDICATCKDRTGHAHPLVVRGRGGPGHRSHPIRWLKALPCGDPPPLAIPPTLHTISIPLTLRTHSTHSTLFTHSIPPRICSNMCARLTRRACG